MSEISIDSQWFPIVVVRYPSVVETLGSISDFLLQLDSVFERAERYAMVTDIRDLRMPLRPDQRALVSRWLSQRTQILKQLRVGNALLATNSPLMRGTLNGFYQSSGTSDARQVFHAMEEAVEWCASLLLAGQVISPTQAKLLRTSVDTIPASTGATQGDEACEKGVSSDDYSLVLDLYEHPAFLLDATGEVVHRNRAAAEKYQVTPAWLALAVSPQPELAVPLCRIVTVTIAGEPLFVVVPERASAGRRAADPRCQIALPPSLERVAELLAQGLTDKEISQATELTLSTTRTYVARLFRRMKVHGRAEFMVLWAARVQD